MPLSENFCPGAVENQFPPDLNPLRPSDIPVPVHLLANITDVLKGVCFGHELPKDDVFELVVELRSLMKGPPRRPIGQFFVSQAVYETIVDHVRNNRKIPAIRDLRSHAMCGLKEAKDAIEATFPSFPPPSI